MFILEHTQNMQPQNEKGNHVLPPKDTHCLRFWGVISLISGYIMLVLLEKHG